MSKTFEHDGCVGCKYEKESESSDYCKGCKQNAVDKYVRMTNFDRIKDMSVEEMAEFILKASLHDGCAPSDCIDRYDSCKDCFMEWLEMEVEE